MALTDKILEAENDIVHIGEVWRLNPDADPNLETEWLKRQMWLTSTGGLFYFSQQYNKPLGRSIAGLIFHVSDVPTLGRYVAEVRVAGGHESMLLATDALAERDVWVRHLQQVQKRIEDEGSYAYDPLAPFVGVGRLRDRVRMASKQISKQAPMSRQCSSGKESGKQTSPRSRISSACENDGEEESYADRLIQYLDTSHLACLSSLQEAGDVIRKTSEGNCDDFGVSEGAEYPKGKSTMVRRNSQAGFAEKSNTMLVLDWDDTIFPTTFLRQDCELNLRHTIDEQLEEGKPRADLEEMLSTLAEKVEAFIRGALASAHVRIITLARTPWVTMSIEKFMRRLDFLSADDSNIKVIYARDSMTEDLKKESTVNAFKSSNEQVDFYSRVKAAAMIEEFQNLCEENKGSWKNIISIGDSNIERGAIVRVAENYVRKMALEGTVKMTGLTSEWVSKDGHLQRLRTKAVKMLDDPSCDELIAQMTLLSSWLTDIIDKDAGFDIELRDSEDDEKLNESHTFMTGRSENLSWLELAGLDEQMERQTSSNSRQGDGVK